MDSDCGDRDFARRHNAYRITAAFIHTVDQIMHMHWQITYGQAVNILNFNTEGIKHQANFRSRWRYIMVCRVIATTSHVF